MSWFRGKARRLLSRLGSDSGLVVSVAILDHSFFLTMLYLGGREILDIHRSLVWTLFPSMLSCVVRVRDDPGNLPRICLGPVLFLHILQTVMLHQALNWEERRNTSVMVFIEALTCATILCADLIVVIAGHNRALLLRLQPMMGQISDKDMIIIHEAPKVEKLECTEADLEDMSSSSCVVCLEDVQAGEKIGRLQCLHMFHEKCLDDWLNNCQQPPWCPFRCPPGFVRSSGRQQAQPEVIGAPTEFIDGESAAVVNILV